MIKDPPLWQRLFARDCLWELVKERREPKMSSLPTRGTFISEMLWQSQHQLNDRSRSLVLQSVRLSYFRKLRCRLRSGSGTGSGTPLQWHGMAWQVQEYHLAKRRKRTKADPICFGAHARRRGGRIEGGAKRSAGIAARLGGSQRAETRNLASI